MSLQSKYRSIQEAAYEANLELPNLDLVLFTFGNASAVDYDLGAFAIKPSGVKYEDLQVSDMVVVDLEGQVIEGKLRPSSDTKTHLVLYRHWKHLGGIVHTHSTYATAWSQTGMDIPLLGTTHADHQAFDIPCMKPMADERIEGDYEYETGLQLIEGMKNRNLDPRQVCMALIANHAPFTWAETVTGAVHNAAVLELIAKMAWIAKTIRPDVLRMKESLVDKHWKRKHGDQAYYGQIGKAPK